MLFIILTPKDCIFATEVGGSGFPFVLPNKLLRTPHSQYGHDHKGLAGLSATGPLKQVRKPQGGLGEGPGTAASSGNELNPSQR